MGGTLEGGTLDGGTLVGGTLEGLALEGLALERDDVMVGGVVGRSGMVGSSWRYIEASCWRSIDSSTTSSIDGLWALSSTNMPSICMGADWTP